VNIEVGQVYTITSSLNQIRYTMTITKIENGIVTWDGIYSKGYTTDIPSFEMILQRDGWELENGQ
jgi:hypothetical protein